MKEFDHVTTLSPLEEISFEGELGERQCPHCRSIGASLTQTTASCPEHLLASIERFSWNSVTQTAKFLDQARIVSPYNQLSRSYDLHVIIHYEVSLNSGHYSSNTKKNNFAFSGNQ